MVQEEHEQAQGLWSVPLGRVEDNESMREAARRELSEETGYKARLQNEVFSKQMVGNKLNSLERFNSRDALLKVFSGSIVGGAPSESVESLSVAWHARSKVKNGELPLREDWVQEILC